MTIETALPGLRFAYMVIAVDQLDRMCAWYERMLGFSRIHGGYLEQLDTDFAVLEGQGIRIELTSPRGQDKQRPISSAFPECMNWPGWKVFTLSCDDLPTLDAHLHRQQADFVWSMRQLTPKFRSTQIRDPEGNLINIFG